MKKRLLEVSLPIICIVLILMSCSSDSKAKSKDATAKYKSFVSVYYPSATIIQTEKDRKYDSFVYEVELSDGTDIDFNADGEWLEIEADDNRTLPKAFLEKEVPGINSYVNATYTHGIENIEHREGYGYEVELADDLEILFDEQQNYLSSSYEDLDITSRVVSLPEAAQSFITNNFSGASVRTAYQDRDDGRVEYEVTLTNGIYIEFDANGKWRDIDGEHANAGVYIPAIVLPEATQIYLSKNYPEAKIIEIELERTNYEVEIYTLPKKDLVFDADGEYIRTDGSRH